MTTFLALFTCASMSQSFYTGPIIDMHLHAYTDSNPMFGMTHPPTLRGETFNGVASPAEQRERTLSKLSEHNIVKAVVTNGELWKDNDSEAILIGKSSGTIEMLRRLHQEGNLQLISEMTPFYDGVLADDPSQLPYFELAQELDIPVGIHIFPGGPNYGFHIMPEMLGGMRTYNANPLQLEDVLVKFPSLRLYIMHGGWPYVDDVKALMYAHPNVYVGIGALWVLPQEEFNEYIKALSNAGFGNRIMFGTDQMVWPQTIDAAINMVNSAEFLSLEQKEDIFFDNAAEFLRLSEEETQLHKGL